MKILKNKWFICICVFIILLFGAGAGIGNYFVNYALSPSSDSVDRNVKEEVVITDDAKRIIAENKAKEDEKGNSFQAATWQTGVTSDDGISLKAKYRTQSTGNKWAILVHGYKSENNSMMSYAAEYYSRGYNVLLPNNRAHGDSEGKYIGMGWLDKNDIISWINWITEQDNEAEIILHGISMGGATVMMASGMNHQNVIGYIEDCGYTSTWDIFSSELKTRFSLPPFPIMHISNIVANMKAGYDFKEASSLEQVKKCQKPILFIHGGKDDFVPTYMLYTLYDAASCEKDMYLVENAGHSEAKNYNPTAYWDKVFSFIDSKIIK